YSSHLPQDNPRHVNLSPSRYFAYPRRCPPSSPAKPARPWHTRDRPRHGHDKATRPAGNARDPYRDYEPAWSGETPGCRSEVRSGPLGGSPAPRPSPDAGATQPPRVLILATPT